MSLSTIAEIGWSEPQLAAGALFEASRTERIMAALGVTAGELPKVNEGTLARYYTYLSARLPLPLVAYYPQPTNAREKAEFRGAVVELLDPAEYLGDEFDGIFCKVRKGRFEVNLPLLELHLPESSSSFQLIDDYWYWFWNWR